MSPQRFTTIGLIAAFSLTLVGCGGSDDDGSGSDTTDAVESVEDDVTTDTVSTPDGDASTEPAPEPASPDAGVEIPANWDPSVPTAPIEAMTLTFAGVRGEGDQAIYELQYDGTGQDGEALFDAYEALALEAGWVEADIATPLVGSFSMDDRTLSITTFGAENSQIIVAAAPN